MGTGIHVFAITGGDCGGKSTGMARLKLWFSERGYRVLVVPEAASAILNAGIKPGPEDLSNPEFQEIVMKWLLMQEDLVFSAAIKYRDMGCKVVVLCDRGALDNEAYIDKPAFRTMLQGFNLTHAGLADHRYHAVFHLRSVAFGREDLYELERLNNPARILRTPAEVRDLDQRTLEAWQRHAHVRVIDNSTDFDTKIQRLFAEALAVIGDPVPVEKERKFLVKKISPDQVTVPYAISRITQTYLSSPNPDETARVRMRESDGGVSYYHTVKKWIAVGEKLESELIITEREYEALLESRDSDRSVVIKDRVCFFWKDEFFELDLFVEPTMSDLVCGDIALLEVERLVHGPIQWPDFIENPVEVTEDHRYSNDQIALCKNAQ